MPRRTAPYLLLLALALILAAAPRPAAADERVPAISDRDLPVVGTCAPIDGSDVSIVTVGKASDARWFQVSGVAAPVDFNGLIKVLGQRAGATRPSKHSVWITASARHSWVHAKRVRNAAAVAGIYRTGLRVRSEATGQVMGFPLFLPPGPTGVPGPKAGLLKLRINTVSAKERKASSDAGHAYAAARRAIEKRAEFGVQKVIASVWIATNARLQYALTTLDLLYRGGCSGVRVSSGMQVPRLDVEPVTILEIQGGVASRIPQKLKPGTLMPRRAPWGLLGPAEAGWVDFVPTKLPALDGSRPVKGARPELRPNYAAQPNGVPSSIWKGVDQELRTWMTSLGADLTKGLRGGDLKERFTIGLRRKETLPTYVAPARRAFPDATSVIPATLQVNSLLFRGGSLVGRADVTLLLAGDRLRVIFATWIPLEPTSSGTLVPFAVDPFAAGDAAALRVWIEALYAGTKRYGMKVIPLATGANVLPYFPAVAHRSLGASIRGGGPNLEAFAAGLKQTAFDRVVISVKRGTASVLSGRRVLGVLNFSLRAEEGQMRLDDLKPRRAK